MPDLSLLEIIGFVVPGMLICGLAWWTAGLIRILRQRRALRYTDRFRAEELTGRVRRLKVRGYEEQAIQLAQAELGMPVNVARSWVRSI
ncbi:hypothetical protein [Nonomuraea sp. NPDC050783]|uniref:hypothetical protein n=1 Tax=Nonomuraea sp. NPDC050783 TaxID=3154634 RepID=UPI00346665EF